MLQVGHYGVNGHAIFKQVEANPRAKLVAVSAIPEARLEQLGLGDDVARHADLAAMLADDAVQLVCFCSPRRADQAEQIVAALEAGKHVYAEKPCAFTEAALDRIIAAATANDVVFHEMAGSAWHQPYATLRETVQTGVLGDIIQIAAQKSYPLYEGRPQDEDLDGGLLMQAGIHAYRWIEHVAGVRIADVEAAQTQLGNKFGPGELRIASTVLCTLENGGIATCSANYLNPKDATDVWGYESLRIFGSAGILESEDGGRRVRLMLQSGETREIAIGPEPDFFALIVDQILDGAEFPLTQDAELHPLRIAIRARAKAVARG